MRLQLVSDDCVLVASMICFDFFFKVKRIGNDLMLQTEACMLQSAF